MNFKPQHKFQYPSVGSMGMKARLLAQAAADLLKGE